MRKWLFLLVFGILSACGSDEPEPIALADFCTRFEAAMCDGLVHNCECGAVTEQGCRAAVSAACIPDDPTLRANIDNGTVRYDGVAAARLIAKLTAAGPDCEAGITAGWHAPDFFTAAGVWTGSKVGGATCLFPSIPGLPNDCANGSCSLSRRICIAAVAEGQECDATHECYDFAAPFPAYQRCDHVTLGEANTCMPFLELGEACTTSNQCATGLCESGACAFFVSLSAFGTSCISDSACQSGYCNAGSCGHAVCGDFAVHSTP